MYTYAGIKRSHGLTRADKKPFDRTSVLVLVPVEDLSRGNYNESGYGMKVEELDCQPDLMPLFADIEPLTELDFDFKPRPDWAGKFWINSIISS